MADLDELLRYAEGSDDVIGVYLFGSRGRPDGLPDERSDYDVGVVLRDEADLESFDERWPYVHGARVEIARARLSELRVAGDYGTPSAWTRPIYAAVDLRLDKTGEVAAILEEKRRSSHTLGCTSRARRWTGTSTRRTGRSDTEPSARESERV